MLAFGSAVKMVLGGFGNHVDPWSIDFVTASLSGTTSVAPGALNGRGFSGPSPSTATRDPSASRSVRSGGVCRAKARSTACYTTPWMPRDITQRELRNESGEIMRQLDRGE